VHKWHIVNEVVHNNTSQLYSIQLIGSIDSM